MTSFHPSLKPSKSVGGTAIGSPVVAWAVLVRECSFDRRRFSIDPLEFALRRTPAAPDAAFGLAEALMHRTTSAADRFPDQAILFCQVRLLRRISDVLKSSAPTFSATAAISRQRCRAFVAFEHMTATIAGRSPVARLNDGIVVTVAGFGPCSETRGYGLPDRSVLRFGPASACAISCINVSMTFSRELFAA